MKKLNRRSLPAPPTNIYDQFLIVGLKEETLVPTVLYTYPSVQNPAAPNVALFCFPEDICADTVNRIRTGASFFFVLTDEVGRQQVGFTRRVGRGKDMRCLCMLTHRDSSWMYTFGSILEECEGRYKAKGNQLESFLSALYNAPVPEPGMDIAKQAPKEYGAVIPPLCHMYSRPIACPDTTDTALFGVTMIPLLANLTTTPILQLFASLLFERRTILVSSQLERVSACVQAAVSALFPFAWHHIFIPVLPLSLVDYCSAPMPFIIGLHSSLMLSIQKMPLSEVVYVDIDRDQVSAVPADLALLPPSLLSPLKAVLDTATAEFHTNSSASKSNFDWQRVTDAFRQFFVRVFAGYGKFFINKVGYGVHFDKEAFIASQPKNIRKFLEAFCASQMFERFIAEREVGKQNAIFENEIKLQEVAQQHAGIGNAIQDKAKKSVERLTTFGAAVRNHLQENPFGYNRNNQDPAASFSLSSRSNSNNNNPSLHPSLVRGQVPTASATTDNVPSRKPKPLPPIPVTNNNPSSAFPPNDFPKKTSESSLNPWDSFNDNNGAIKPTYVGGRPKSATVTSSSNTPAVVVSHHHGSNHNYGLPHSNSTNSISPSSPLAPDVNFFDFTPFPTDHTPATPAPSISNSVRAPDWFSPGMASGSSKLASVSSSDPLNPFYTPSPSQSHPISPLPSNPSASLLPPVSMKPLNPFQEAPIAASPAIGGGHDDRPDNGNLFTSFSLDALAPPDMHNVHLTANNISPSYIGSGGGSGGYFSTTPNSSSLAASNGFGSPAGVGQPTLSSSGGTVPNYKAGGTVPNNWNSGNPNMGGDNLQQQQQQQQQSGVPIPSSNSGHGRSISLNGLQPEQQHDDDFDSFLASRIKHM